MFDVKIKKIIALNTVVTELESIKENEMKNSALKAYKGRGNHLILILNKTKHLYQHHILYPTL
jgi:hypothetical protein